MTEDTQDLSHSTQDHFSQVPQEVDFPQREEQTLHKQRTFLFRELQQVATHIESSENLYQALVNQREAIEHQRALMDDQSRALEEQYAVWEKHRKLLNEYAIWLEHEYAQLMPP